MKFVLKKNILKNLKENYSKKTVSGNPKLCLRDDWAFPGT